MEKGDMAWTEGGHEYVFHLEVIVKDNGIGTKYKCLKDDREISLEEMQASYARYLKGEGIEYK